MQLDLFRIRVFPKTAHGSLFTQNLEPAEVLRRALLERPRSHQTKRGVDWHVGNVEELEEGNVYFRLGKQSRATLSRIDNTGNFTEAELENAPYTHAVLDFGLELCALAKNTALSPSTIGIARRLQPVLNDSKTALENEVSFVVGRVNNPDGFLNLLSSAYSIRSVDAKNARPPGTWKTAENAVSHSAHTHYCFRERMIENGESTSVAKPSTESDQAQLPSPNENVLLTRIRPGRASMVTPRGASTCDHTVASSSPPVSAARPV